MAGSPQKRARREAERKAALATIEGQAPPPALCGNGQHLTQEKVAELRIQIVAMAQVGLTVEQMGYLLGVTERTIRDRFPEEVKAASVIANGLVAASMLRKAIDGDVRAQELWLREHAGWFEQRKAPQPDIPPDVARELEEARRLRAENENDEQPQRSLLIEFVDPVPEAAT